MNTDTEHVQESPTPKRGDTNIIACVKTSLIPSSYLSESLHYKGHVQHLLGRLWSIPPVCSLTILSSIDGNSLNPVLTDVHDDWIRRQGGTVYYEKESI